MGTLSTPLLRLSPGVMPNLSSLLHSTCKAGAPSGPVKSGWTLVLAEEATENCFVTRTRFLRSNGENQVTAQDVKDGDELLGPEGVITVVKAAKYENKIRAMVSITTRHHTRPFEITADHRLGVEGSGGIIEYMVAEDFALLNPEKRPRLLCWAGFVEATEVKLDRAEYGVIGLTFAKDATVWAWLLAEKRPKKGHSSVFSEDRGVACKGETSLQRDLIQRFLAGEFTPEECGCVTRKTFLDVKVCENGSAAARSRSV